MTTIREAAADGGSQSDDAGEAATALPRLDGWKFVLFRVLWLASLALAVAAPLAGIYYQMEEFNGLGNASRSAGLRINTSDGTIRMGRPFGQQALSAGIVAGQRLVAIDGVALPSGTTRLDVARRLAGRDGSSLAIRTRGADGVERDHVLTRSSAHAEQEYAGSGLNPRSFATIDRVNSLFPPVFLIAAAILLFLRRSRDPVAALLSVSLLLTAATTFLTYYFYSRFGLERLQTLVNLVSFFGLMLVLFVFPHGRFFPPWTRFMTLAIPLYLAASFFGLIDETVDEYLFACVFLSGVVSLFQRYRLLQPGTEQQQIRWVMLGFAASGAFVIAATCAATMRSLLDGGPADVWLNLLSRACFMASVALMALGLLVSMLRYRLYDADAAISRSAGYAVLTLLLAGTFGASAKGLEIFFETSFGRDAGALPSALGAGLAVVLITPMHNRIHRWAERRFQKALLHLKRDLPDCVGDLRETAGMGELLEEVLARVEAGTRAVRSAVTIGGETVATRGDGAGEFPLAVPLRIGHQQAEIGTLLVGPRPDGSVPGKDEREALAEIADPIARAVRIVATREAREAALTQRIGAIEQALATISESRRAAPI